jgi:hypothetical protein
MKLIQSEALRHKYLTKPTLWRFSILKWYLLGMNVGFKTASQPECSVGIKMDVTCETSELNFYLLSINLICFNHHNDGFPCSQCDKSLLNYGCFSSLNRPKIPELPIRLPTGHPGSPDNVPLGRFYCWLTGQRSVRPSSKLGSWFHIICGTSQWSFFSQLLKNLEIFIQS